MADRILNINGELIRLKDLADGSWAWATQLTGSSVFQAAPTTVDTAATELKGGASRLSTRRRIHIVPMGSSPIYVGHSTSVTVLTGLPVYPGERLTLEVGNVPVYGIAASSQEVRVLEE